MPVSKAQQKAQNKWIAKAYDRVNLTLPKGQKEVVQAHAAAQGESVNGFINRAITETIERDGGKMPRKGPQETAGATKEGGAVPLPSAELDASERLTEGDT